MYIPSGTTTCWEVLHVLMQKQAKEKVKIKHLCHSSIDFHWFQKQVETYPRPERTEQISEVRKVQNGETRKCKYFLANRPMGNVHQFQGHLLPYPNKPTVQEMPTFSHPRSILPIQSSTVWSVFCCHGIHSGSQGSQADGSK